MRRILTLSTVLVLVAGFLFGGGEQERAEAIEDYEPDLSEEELWDEDLLGPQPEFPDLAGEEVTLTLTTFAEDFVPFLQSWADRFEELFGYIDLEIEIQRSPYDEMHDSLASQLVAGTGAPDLVTVEVGETPRFFVPPYETEFRELELPGQVSDILVRQEPYRDSNGVQRGIEVADPHPGFLYYREDIFEEAGVDIDDIETWDDYIAAGEQIREETGHYLANMPIEAQVDSWAPGQLFIQNGNPIYEDGEFVLNNENTLEVLETIVEAHEKGVLTDEYVDDATVYQRYVGEIEEEQIASMISPNWYFSGRVMPEVDEPNWRIAPAPKFETTDNDSFTWGGTSIAVVESQSDYPELAEAYIMYALTTHNQLDRFTSTNYLPVTEPALQSDTFREHTEPDIYGDQPIGEIYSDAVVEDMPGFQFGETWPQVNEEFEATFYQILDDPQAWLDHMESYEADLD